jgi:sortase A
MTAELRPRTRSARKAPRSRVRRKVSIVGVIGEIFITAGVLVFLFLGWQLWLNDIIVGADQNKSGIALGHHLEKAAPPHEDTVAPDAGPTTPVVAVAPGNATQFGVMYVPRLGADYSRSISEGVGTRDVLDKNGIGHYPGTQMPGQVGNFAVAAHRTTHGAPFRDIATLLVGDKIYVQTADGWYTYVFRGLEYVRPTGVGVIDPVPQAPGIAPTDRVMTMTSCNPKLSSSERIIAYAAFDSFSVSSPKELAATLAPKG